MPSLGLPPSDFLQIHLLSPQSQGHKETQVTAVTARSLSSTLSPGVVGPGKHWSHRGSDVSLGLPQLLSQSLCQRCDSMLGRTIEMDRGLGDHTVASHAGWREGARRENEAVVPHFLITYKLKGSGSQVHWRACYSSSVHRPTLAPRNPSADHTVLSPSVAGTQNLHH